MEKLKEAAEAYARLQGNVGSHEYDNALLTFDAGAQWEADSDKWISCEDRFPIPNNTGVIEVLAYINGSQAIVLHYVKHEHNTGNFYMDYKNHFDTLTDFVTHWQPLPPAPKTQ